MPRSKSYAHLCVECLSRNKRFQGKEVYIPTDHEMKSAKARKLLEAGCTEEELVVLFKTTRRGLGMILRENHKKRARKAKVALKVAEPAKAAEA